MTIHPNVEIAYQWLAEHSDPVAQSWHRSLVDEMPAQAQSLKSWLTGRESLDTLQVTVRDGQVTRAWAPGVREVDTSAATFARLEGSRRDYAGVTAQLCGRDVWVGYDTSMDTVLIYREP